MNEALEADVIGGRRCDRCLAVHLDALHGELRACL